MFIRLFLSEHLMGETQNQIKKLLASMGKHIPAKINYLPADLLYLFHKKNKTGGGQPGLNSTMGSVTSTGLNDTTKSRKRRGTDRLGHTSHSIGSMGHLVLSKDDTRHEPLFMTIAYRNDAKQVMIEVPLDRERNFMILNASLMLQGCMKDS